MDAARACEVRVAANRLLLIVIPLSALLAVSVGWNVQHHRTDRDRSARAKAQDRASRAADALAKEYADRAKLKRQARETQSNARIQQLQQEIDNLTRVTERILLPEKAMPNASATTDGSEPAADHP